MAADLALSPSVHAFWADFLAVADGDASARFYESFHFGDSDSLADELAALVHVGAKRATASLLWSFEAEGKPLPKPGDLSIVERWSGEPICVIETSAIAIVPFDDVGPEFAAAAGEDDGSLESWRRGHWSYFGRQCARIGREPDAGMPVVCESFRVVFRRPGPAP